ncbi:glycosyltransferase [Caenimonas sp. SL110]|uniref:glycosyltransferase n=1 Tax=Caenimonas sp. SL110 TaxID=1450524 RepID=UPI000652C012|nr:glycosyltransferase [Caenimonas sp. SL110]
MKVLHVIPSLAEVHGGATAALLAMERAISVQGIAVETATTDDDGPGQHNGRPCGVALAEDGITRWYFRKGFEFYKVSGPFATWIASNAKRYDLLHIHALFSFTSVVAAMAAHRAGVPYIIEPIGTLNRYGMTQRRPALKRLSMRFIEGPILARAAAVRFTSQQEAAEAVQQGLTLKPVVIPLGVQMPDDANLCERPAGGDARGFTLLFLSRLDPKKNLEGLLDAFALLAKERPNTHSDVRLTIAGDGPAPYVASLKARASALAMADRIHWAGHVEGDDKRRAFEAADIFVLPSHSENFGMAAAEALACGVPCLLGRGVAVSDDVVQAAAGIAVTTDAADIARGLHFMMADRSALRTMSINARQLALTRFSMQAMGERLSHLYTEILAR